MVRDEIKMERVQKIIVQTGHCSRRKAEALIIEGKVKVNGETITIGDKAEITDKISIDGKELKIQKKRYLMLYKPKGYVTTLKDPYAPKNVSQLIKLPERVFPVGRLDKDAEGLLLMTNDGDFANHYMHPRYNIMKTYHATLNKTPSQSDIAKIKGKIDLEDGPAVIHKCHMLDIAKGVVLITVHEGRNKIVKRIFKHFGYYVTKLVRVKMGRYSLEHLRPGQWREIKPIKLTTS